jgi:pyrophosphatase PpaX
MNLKRTILFDLDGTLIDTTNLILRCFDHSWRTVCGLTHPRESIVETFGVPLREAMIRLAASNGPLPSVVETSASVDLIERLLTEYRCFNVANHDNMVDTFDGVKDVLAALRSRGYLIGVVTSKSRELALRGLRVCSLEPLIDAAVFLEDTRSHKPGPEPILAALERLNASASSAAYVGDSRHDIVAGRRAGVRTIAAGWGPAPRAELEEEGPDYFADSVHDLLEFFE